MAYVLAPTVAAEITKGADKELQLELLDQAGDPYDLAGTTVVFRMAHSYTDTYSVLEVLGDILEPAAEGKVKFDITTAMSAGLSVKAYDFDVWVDDYPACRGRIGVESALPGVES